MQACRHFERLNHELARAIGRYEFPRIRTLLEQGADVRTRGQNYDGSGLTILMVAAQRNEVALLGEALERGAELEGLSSGGESALSYAAMAGHVEAVRFLVSRGANVNQRDDAGYTPLMLADPFENPALIRPLKEAGARY